MPPCNRRLQSLLLAVAAAALFAAALQPASAISLRLRHVPHRTPAPAPTDPLDTQLAGAMQDVKTYATARTVQPLQLAVYQISTAPRLDASSTTLFVAQRRSLVRAWAAVFGAIDLTYGQKFNAEDRRLLAFACSVFPPAPATPAPTATPSPPVKASLGALLERRLTRVRPQEPQTCVDPRTIKNARVRKDYEGRLNHYYEVAESALEAQLHQIDPPAMAAMTAQLERVRESAPQGTPSDFNALDAELEQAGIAFDRRARLDTVFVGDTLPWR